MGPQAWVRMRVVSCGPLCSLLFPGVSAVVCVLLDVCNSVYSGTVDPPGAILAPARSVHSSPGSPGGVPKRMLFFISFWALF